MTAVRQPVFLSQLWELRKSFSHFPDKVSFGLYKLKDIKDP